MPEKIKSVVIIPAYEPPIYLISYAKELLSSDIDEIIVINDGSPKKYNKVFKELSLLPNITLLNNRTNRGKGYSLKTAFSYCIKNYSFDTVFATADCDGQHVAKDVVNCIEKAKKNYDSFILGARNFKLKHVPKSSKADNFFTRLLFKILYGVKITDTKTGLRAFSYKLLKPLCDVAGDRFEYEMNCLVIFNKNNIPFIEVPIETVYQDKTDDVEKGSHFRSVVDTFKVLKVLFKHAKLKIFTTLAVVLAIIIATIIIF